MTQKIVTKKDCWIIAISIILAVLVLNFAQQFKKQNQDKAPLGNESTEITQKQSDSPQRNSAIEEYLLTQRDFSWQTEENSQRTCVFDNLGNADDLFPLSLWVLCQEYIIQDGEIEVLSSSSGPALVDYPNELSFFSIDKFSHKIPRDGSLYGDDVRQIFSPTIRSKILNYQRYNNIEKLQKLFEQKVLTEN